MAIYDMPIILLNDNKQWCFYLTSLHNLPHFSRVSTKSAGLCVCVRVCVYAYFELGIFRKIRVFLAKYYNNAYLVN